MIFGFGDFIVTTSIMLILIENWFINQAFKWTLLYPIFSWFYFPYFFPKKKSYFLYFFTLKCHLRNKNTEMFPLMALLAWIFENIYYIISGSRLLKFQGADFLSTSILNF